MFDEFEEELKRMQRLMKNFWSWPNARDFRLEIPEFREPLMDIEETENELKLTFELPGISKEDIDIDLTEDRITIKAKKKETIEEKKKGFYKEERFYKGFYRSVALPCKILPEKAEATYKDGLLTITIPKKEKKAMIKKVKIK